MRTAFRYLFVAALVLSTCAMRAASGHAQELTADQQRLVLALIGLPVGDAEVLVGRAPAGFPLEDFPPDATVLGSAVARGRPLTVVAVPGAATEGEAAIQAALLAAGWARTPFVPNRIFAPSKSWGTEAPAGPASFCRGEQMIRVLPPPSGSEVTFFNVHWDDRAPRCGPPDYPPQLNPMLTTPDGARQTGNSGSSSSPRSLSARVQIETERTVEEVAAHYVAQLAAVGWTVGPSPESGNGDRIASRSLVLETADEPRWDGRVAVVRLPGADEVEVHVSFERAGRRFRRP